MHPDLNFAPQFSLELSRVQAVERKGNHLGRGCGGQDCRGTVTGRFAGRFSVTLGKVRMHRGAGRVGMDLDEELPDHFPAQPLAALGQLARGLLRTHLAGKPG